MNIGEAILIVSNEISPKRREQREALQVLLDRLRELQPGVFLCDKVPELGSIERKVLASVVTVLHLYDIGRGPAGELWDLVHGIVPEFAGVDAAVLYDILSEDDGSEPI